MFQTLNQAKMIWDPCCKPKGLLGGHLNIRSMIPKRKQCMGVDIILSTEMTFTVICIYRKPSAKLDFYSNLKTLINLTNVKK